jgi:acyl carrier protein
MYLNGEFNKELEALKSLRVSEMEDKLPQTGDSLEKKVLEMMTKTWDVEALSLDDNFLEKCTDSLNLVAAVANLEKELEISLSVSDFFAYPTVRKIASFIKFLKESDDSLYIQINGDISEYSPGYGYREEEINISIGQNIVAVITGLSQTVGVEPYSIMAASFIRMLQGICAENIVNVLISARDGSNLKHVRYAKNSLPEGNELYKIIFAEQSRLMDVNVDSIKRVDADNKDGMRFIHVFIKSQNEMLISTKRNLFDLVFSFNPRNQNAITIK